MLLDAHHIDLDDILDPLQSSSVSSVPSKNKPLHTSTTPTAKDEGNPSRRRTTKLAMRAEMQAKLDAKHEKIQRRTTRKMEAINNELLQLKQVRQALSFPLSP